MINDDLKYRYRYANRHNVIRTFLLADEGYLRDHASLEYKIEDLRRRREIPRTPNYMAPRLARLQAI